MTTVRCFRRFMISILALSALRFQPALAGDVPEYSDVKAAVAAAYQARSALLRRSTGTVDMTLKKEEATPGAARKMEQMFADEFGADPEGFRVSGEGVWTTTWYQKDSRIRYDMVVPASGQEQGARRPFLTRRDMRIAVDPEKGVYYDAINKHAYIHKPPTPAKNPHSLARYFRLERLYQFNGSDVPDLLARCEKAGITPTCTREQVGQTPCVRLCYSHERDMPGGKKDRGQLVLWLAPQQSYSLIKAQLRGNWAGREQDLVTIETYEAAYQQCEGFEGIWLLKDVKLVDKQGLMSETLTAALRDTRVGIEIPDETFTFDGLGVPPGTKISDKTLAGQPLSYYYKSFPAAQLDSLAQRLKALPQEEPNCAAKDSLEQMHEAETTAKTAGDVAGAGFTAVSYVAPPVAVVAILMAWYWLHRRRQRRTVVPGVVGHRT